MGLAARDERLVRLAVAVALGDWQTLERLRAEAPPGEPDRAWREAVLQTHLFCGFPRTVEATLVLERAGGLGPHDLGELPPREREQAGDELFLDIYRDQAEPVAASLSASGGVFAHWIREHAYGRVLARPGLEPARRELLAVACLTALGPERQLASHVRGALRCGAEREQLKAALECVRPSLDPARLAHALKLIERLAAD